MLNDLREVTLNGVQHLSKEQLFQVPIEGEFPIGAYLMHLAECDIHWLEEISGVKQSDELKKKSYFDVWYDCKKPEPPTQPLEYQEYLDVITETRKNFMNYLDTISDDDLELVARKVKDWDITKKWIVYHILEHEAHHRGQMFMLIRKAGWNKKKS